MCFILGFSHFDLYYLYSSTNAPNAVEELKQPGKHPTAEKVEAIKDALKHFEVWNKREEKENEIKNV